MTNPKLELGKLSIKHQKRQDFVARRVTRKDNEPRGRRRQGHLTKSTQANPLEEFFHKKLAAQRERVELHPPLEMKTYPSDEVMEEIPEEPSLEEVFPVLQSPKILFSGVIEIKVDELPRWKPNIVIDDYHLEDDDE